jgi:hypothetical protein
MTIIIPAGYAQIVVNWTSPTFFTGNAATTWGVSIEASTAAQIAEEVGLALSDAVLPLVAEDVVLASVECIEPSFASTYVMNVAGARDDPQAEPSLAILTRKVAPGRGRRQRGRCYWPGMVYEATFDNRGLMNVGSLADYQAAFDTLRDGMERELVILQSEEGVTPPIDPPPTFTQFIVDQRAATQRRRLRG